LGVTEAGEAEDGRIKSAVGIGTLLEDGLGDTIRVSLTEEPEAEIPVALRLVDRNKNRSGHAPIPAVEDLPYDPFFRTRQETDRVEMIGGEEVPRVVCDLSKREKILPQDLVPIGYLYSEPQDKWQVSDQAVDFLFVGDRSIDFAIPGMLGVIQNAKNLQNNNRHYPFYSIGEIKLIDKKMPSFLAVSLHDLTDPIISSLERMPKTVLVLKTDNKHSYAEQRRFFVSCIHKGLKNPILVKRTYSECQKDQLLLYAATDLGGLQIDGLGDGIWIESDLDSGFVNETAFGILQACRTRISKTEYISCPSCGRTLFDLQETTATIRARTDHLKGVKIDTVAGAKEALTKIVDALGQLHLDRAGLGAIQSRIEFTNGQLTTSKQNLSQAKSRITDVDVASESTEYARQQILVQSGTQMLREANNLPRTALELLR